MPIRLAIIISHPIPHFAPWHRELARISDIDSKVFFCCDLGLNRYVDPQFKAEFKWDIPLVDGYGHEFLPISERPKHCGFWEIDNPSVSTALGRFNPDVVKIFGYVHRTHWRAARWAHKKNRPLLLYSDSNARTVPPLWKRIVKDIIVRHFYDAHVDGALCTGDNNRLYHLRYGIPLERLFPGVLPVECRRLLESLPDRAVARRDIRRRFGIPQDAFTVLFCGKFTRGKRPSDLALAVRRLCEDGLQVWALMIGEGEQKLAVENISRAAQKQNVILTGFVNQSTISQYYAAADALVVTSEVDNHPLVVSEGACFGLPVIISDRAGCIGPTDSAQLGRNAIAYPCGDVQRLSGAIERICTDRELYNKMAEESFRIAQLQDVVPAAERLAFAVRSLHELGPRKSVAGTQSALRSEATSR